MRIDFSQATRTIQGMIDGIIAALPRLVVALIVLGFFLLVAGVIRSMVERAARRRGERRALGVALSRITQAVLILLGCLVALTVLFPSFTPANVVSTLGIGSVAIGFAFKDVFQNFLAGLLLLITKPFRVGDQIKFGDYEGTVQDIHTRATLLKTYDGRLVFIPNGELFTSSVVVNTAYKQRRMEYEFTIPDGESVDRAKQAVLHVLQDLPDVLPDPQADVVVVALTDSGYKLRARWWSASEMTEVLKAQDHVLVRIKQALLEEELAKPASPAPPAPTAAPKPPEGAGHPGHEEGAPVGAGR